MTGLAHDQLPESWSNGAIGYQANFEPFTRPYAADAARLLDVGPGSRILDVAAGTGVFSLLAAELGADVDAIDFAPGMIEALSARARTTGASIRAHVMDGQSLTFPDGSFDLAASTFGLMFFPDVDAGLRELVRVLRPDGRVCITTFQLDGFQLMQSVRQALQQVLDPMPPEAPPTWAPYGRPDGLQFALEAAGFNDVHVEVSTHHWEFGDPKAFFVSLPDWSPPIQPLFARLDLEVIQAAAEAFLIVVSESDGLDLTALYGLGRAP